MELSTKSMYGNHSPNKMIQWNRLEYVKMLCMKKC